MLLSFLPLLVDNYRLVIIIHIYLCDRPAGTVSQLVYSPTAAWSVCVRVQQLPVGQIYSPIASKGIRIK